MAARSYKNKNRSSNSESLEMVKEMPPLESSPKRPRSNFFKIALVVVLVAVVAALLFRNKSRFLAATVNGVPISRWELTTRLTERYGKQMLEAMIGERLILDVAAKQNITASDTEVNAKIADLEKTLSGSTSLDESLKLQGISRSEFENQVRIQTLLDKLLTKEVSISAEEVSQYMKANTSSLTASTPAERQQEAEKQIRNNKMTQAFSDWFTKVKEQAKVARYL